VLHSRVGAGVIVSLVFMAGTGAAAQGQKSLEARISTLEQRVTTVEGQLVAQAAQLETQAAQLNTVITRLGAVDARTLALEQGSATLSGQLGAIDARVTTLGNQLGALTTRTTAVEQYVWPRTIDVNCSAQTIASALAQVPFSHLGILTIRISGTCTEGVSVYRGQTVIEGIGPGAEIVAPSVGPVVATPDIRGGAPRSLALRNLTIRGNGSGIGVKADFGASVYLDNVTIVGTQTAVSLYRSMARIEASTIESNGFGVVASNGSHVLIYNTHIRNNADYGLNLENGTTAYVYGSFITGNQGGNPGSIRGAVGLYQGSTLRIAATEISGSRGNGIFGAMGSVVWLEDGVNIHHNGGHGIAMTDTGVVGKYYVPTDIHITNNDGQGIACSPSPGVAQLYGFPPTPGANAPNVSGNLRGDYGCPASPNPVWQQF